MKTFSNFAVSFTIISILSGCLTLFGFAMKTGGPAEMVWGWLVVGFFVTLVALGMAEVASSYPTAGGLYYWSAKLAKTNAPAWSWFTGWFNLLGQVAVTAGIDFGLAFFINAFLNIAFGVGTDPWITIAIYGVVLFLHALLNTFGIRIVALLNDVSVWWHVVGVAIIFIAMFFLAPHHSDLGTVFTSFVNRTSADGVAPVLPVFYVMLIGLLNAQYTLTGYDASAHMSEETHDAAEVGAARDHLVGDHLGHRRVHPPRGDEHRDHPGQGLHRRRRHDGRRLRPRAGGDRRPAGPDLDRRGRPDRRPVHPVRGHRRPVLLRHVVGHGELADDLRVLPRRRDPRQQLLAPDQPRTRTPTNSIWLAAVGAFILGLPYLFKRGRLLRRSPRSRSSACTSPTSRRSSCGCGPGTAPGRPVEPRSLEPADRDRGDDLGRVHRDPVPAAAGQSGINGPVRPSTTPPSPFLGGPRSAAAGGPCRPRTGSRAPRSRGPAEELAAIERDLEMQS